MNAGQRFERRSLIVSLSLSAIALLVVGFFVRLDPNVSALLPSRGDGAVLSHYLATFGGGGVGVVLLEGQEPEDNALAAAELAERLRALPEVAFARERVEAGQAPDPLLIWRSADPQARARLAEALGAAGMRERLAETRQLLLAPGSGAATPMLAADPLRLVQLVLGEKSGIGTGVPAREDGAFATPDGRACLVVVKAKGQALRGEEAKAFVARAEEAMAAVGRAHPSVRIGLTGPHAVAAQMETLLRSDLQRIGVLSSILASLAFILVFGRPRAVIAILIPLAVGTLWTGALAAFWPNGISAIAIAFTSVVVGVGFDSGVHVYAALLEGRRAGLSPADSAVFARKKVMRPVLVAAAIAAVAFGSLALSSVEALVQFGVLCAAGELLTAVAIVLLTPTLGAWLERGPPPKARNRKVFGWLAELTNTRRRALVTLLLCSALSSSVFFVGLRVGDSIVAVRPSGLPALEVEARVFSLFGGKAQPYVVLVEDRTRESAMARADALAESLLSHPELILSVDGLATALPAESTQRARLAERDALDLPKKADELREALVEVGFAPTKFEPVLAAMRDAPHALIDVDARLKGDLGVLAARHLATDGTLFLASLHVQLAHGSADDLVRLVAELDQGANVTGYARLEADLRDALRTDLPRVGFWGASLVLLLLGLSLRRVALVGIAAGVLVLGVALLLTLLAWFGVPLHIYSALVIPVLLGISIDEAMFLLHHAEDNRDSGTHDVIREAIVAHGPAVVATALTTSAGFLALATAGYDGLRDLGRVGALGNVAVLLMSLLVVPAGLRLLPSRGSLPSSAKGR